MNIHLAIKSEIVYYHDYVLQSLIKLKNGGKPPGKANHVILEQRLMQDTCESQQALEYEPM